MNESKHEITKIFDKNISYTYDYLSLLGELKPNDDKKIKALHYSFSATVLKTVSAIDALTFSISTKIQHADKENNFELVDSYSKLFELCIEYRKLLENLLSENEDEIKYINTETPRKIKRNVDTFTRKIIMLKSCL